MAIAVSCDYRLGLERGDSAVVDFALSLAERAWAYRDGTAHGYAAGDAGGTDVHEWRGGFSQVM